MAVSELLLEEIDVLEELDCVFDNRLHLLFPAPFSLQRGVHDSQNLVHFAKEPHTTLAVIDCATASELLRVRGDSKIDPLLADREERLFVRHKKFLPRAHDHRVQFGAY